MKKYLWGVLYAAVLTSFTVYILLDTFVIARVYRQAPSDGVSAAESVEENTAEITGNSYEDGNISVTITEHRVNDTAVYAADVRLKSAEYLKTALSNEAYGKNVTEKTSEIAERNNAVLAINGDYYGSRESGYVLRNGVLYRETAAGGVFVISGAAVYLIQSFGRGFLSRRQD